VSAYTIHIISDDKSIPSSASLAYRDGAMPNFAFWGFCELRLLGDSPNFAVTGFSEVRYAQATPSYAKDSPLGGCTPT
jgi:hypothetical protein